MKKSISLLCFAALLGLCVHVHADGLDIGIGGSMVGSDTAGALDVAYDFQIGYEFDTADGWDFGVQVQFIDGMTSMDEIYDARYYGYSDSTDMVFDASALYFTARPENWWLQLSAGVIAAEYHTYDTDATGTGVALGVGFVVGEGPLRLHLLDYHHYQIGPDAFDTYTVSGIFIFNN